MKKKTLSAKLSLKKIKIVGLETQKNLILGGTGNDLCFYTADCPTAKLCPTNGCPVTDPPKFTRACQPTWQINCSVDLCPHPSMNNCPSFPNLC